MAPKSAQRLIEEKEQWKGKTQNNLWSRRETMSLVNMHQWRIKTVIQGARCTSTTSKWDNSGDQGQAKEVGSEKKG